MAISSPVEAPTATATRRLAVYDGLRGIAILLVVLSHGWTIWPTTRISEDPTLKALFSSGDFAVTVFFVIGAFFATRAMLRSADSELGLLPGVAATRRWIRLSGQMYFLLLVILVSTAVDTTDTYPRTATRESVFRAATYTWNWYVRDHALVARPDLGHLWYLSVDLQMFLVILLFVWLLRRRRAWLVVALSVFFLILLVWRSHIYDVEGSFSALIRTWARGDAPVAGALVAAALPYLRRFGPQLRPLTIVAFYSLIPLLYLNVSAEGYFHLPGVLLDLALMVFVAGCALATVPAVVRWPLERRTLVFLGKHSLSIYLWHYPVYWFLSRHTLDWSWEERVAVAFVITAFACWVSERYVESRVQKWLASPKWRETDQGLGRYLVARSRAVSGRAWHKVRGGRADTDQPAAPADRPVEDRPR